MSVKNRLKNTILQEEKQLEENYFFDKIEFGEVLAVTSIAMLLISVHAAFTINQSIEDLEEVNREFDEVRGVMSTDNFQSSMEALETTAVEISEDFQFVYNNFDELETELDRLEETQQDMEERYRFYQWMVLISIVGIVSGISIIYI